MLIIIPMAGESRRFRDAGFEQPKYMLPLKDRTVFDFAVGGFEDCFDDHDFLFIYREIQDTKPFIKEHCADFGLNNPHLVELEAVTTGQAESVRMGLERSGLMAEDGLAIFNIDTFRPSFAFPDNWNWEEVDGYLEVFEGSGPNWSYVRPSGFGDGAVLETAEKVEISNLCCTGLYYFRNTETFRRALLAHRARKPDTREFYVAPIYNDLIAEGADIRYHQIPADAVTFCGVPAEYEALFAEEADG
jgi:hypothetical protein